MATKPPIISDAELVVRAKSGDHSAYTMIYDRYADGIYRYILYRVRDTAAADDILADVFLRMYEGMERYQERGWPISAWLYRIARDRTIDIIRQRRRQQNISYDTWDGTYDGPELQYVIECDHAELRARIADLSNDQRAVILMRFMANMPLQEVATRMGRSVGSIKALQHRGLQALARNLVYNAV